MILLLILVFLKYTLLTETMRDTALTHIHKKLGAKIISFAGFNMPLEYSGIREEHLCVRNAVGIFDVSHMGEIWVKGAGATSLIQRLTTNDIGKLYSGRVQYTCFPNGKGGILDDLLVYRYAAEKYLLVVNASNIKRDWEWLGSNNRENAVLEDASDQMSLIAVQGPRAIPALQKLTRTDLAKMKYYTFEVGPFAGIQEVIISATGYTGAGGLELYCRNAVAEQLWNAVMDAGSEFGIKPAGLAARDTLRLEMGFCLYGNDIDDTTSPIEAGLGWITRFTEGNWFIDREKFEQEKSSGPGRKLVGFAMLERGIPRQHYEILDEGGQPVGTVTSGTMSPSMNQGIGLGYVRADKALPGTLIKIRIRNKDLQARIVTLPIFKNDQIEKS